MSINCVLTMMPFSNHVYAPPIQLAYLKAFLEQDKDIKAVTFDAEAHYYKSSVIGGSKLLYCEKIWGLQNLCVNNVDVDTKKVLDEIVSIILSRDPQVACFSVTYQNVFLPNMFLSRSRSLILLYILYTGVWHLAV